MAYHTLKLLDDVLKKLRLTTESDPEDLDLRIRGWFPNLSNREYRSVQEKLHRDGFVDSFIPNPDPKKFIPNKLYQFITFEGLVLLESEKGYEGRKKSLEEIQKTNYFLKYLALVSSVVAFGGLLLNFLTYRHLIEMNSGHSSTHVYYADSIASQTKIMKNDSILLHKDSIKQ